MSAEERAPVSTRTPTPSDLLALTVQLVRDGTGSTETLDSIRVLQTWVGVETPLHGCVLVIQAVGVARLSANDHPWLRAFAELGGRSVVSECYIEDAEHLIAAGVAIAAPHRPPAQPWTAVSVASAGAVISVAGAVVHPGHPLPARLLSAASKGV